MELWFTEKQTDNLSYSCRIRQTLWREQTAYQDLLVIDTVEFGRMLVLDGCVMTTERDEFVYHEMLTHVPLFTHPEPKRVLVVGGGDGGAIREILKHPSVEEAVLAEIDAGVIEASRRFLPDIAGALDDARARVLVVDGIAHVAAHKNYYDVIMVDSTDPIGPAVGLFSSEFYQSVFAALKDDGLFVAQSESPFLHGELISDLLHKIGDIFPLTRLYLAAIPTYPSGLWSFAAGSKRHDPAKADAAARFAGMQTRYYTPALHNAAFSLPRFVADLLPKGAQL